MKKNGKTKGIENKPYIEGMRMIRQSNASGVHLDKREKRNRTRQSKTLNAIREQVS
jgi:hypothetical protein